MATIGHLAVGAAIARMLAPRGERPSVTRRRMAIAAVAAATPDADLLARLVGVPPGNEPASHRGAAHALAVGPAVGILLRAGGARSEDAIAVGAALMSHGLTDLLSSSGRGVALFWPFTPRRFGLAWQAVDSLRIGPESLDWRPWLRLALRELAVFWPFVIIAAWPLRRPTGR